MSLRRNQLVIVVILSFAAGCALAAYFNHVQTVRADGNRVFELRVYHALPGQLPALEANFRDHNIALLTKHGITSIGYWVPQDPPASTDTLIFLLAHPSREAAAQHWKEFLTDPEFQKVAKESLSGGQILEKVEATYIAPADYSPLK